MRSENGPFQATGRIENIIVSPGSCLAHCPRILAKKHPEGLEVVANYWYRGYKYRESLGKLINLD